jgi:NAD(P)-dependent dehydrogenase (short-subunit alcohol dehydrogenase family)
VGSAVLVTGATGGLGPAVVDALVAAGRPVVATFRRDDDRDRLEARFPDREAVTLARADLTDAGAVDRLVAGAEDLGAVVNLAGGYAGGGKVHESEPDVLDRMLALNLRPAFLLARAAVPRLVATGGGAFVGVSARAAVRPFAGAAAYIASKAALLALVQALDAEYRADGVRSNAILPSVIDTPANRRDMPDADHSRWVSPEAIAPVVVFLVSPASAPTSGAAIPVYGRA